MKLTIDNSKKEVICNSWDRKEILKNQEDAEKWDKFWNEMSGKKMMYLIALEERLKKFLESCKNSKDTGWYMPDNTLDYFQKILEGKE